MKSVFGALHSFTLFTPGQQVAELTAAWGSTAPVTVAQPISLIGWPGLVATLAVRHGRVGGPLARRRHGRDAAGGRRAGARRTSELQTASALSGPGCGGD